MKRLLIIALLLFVVIGMAFAQAEIGEADPRELGIDSAQQQLKEVSVDKFEHDGFWYASMSADEGYAQSRLFVGGPDGKEAIPDEEGMNIQDQYVLGVRVDYLRRGHHSIHIRPIRPIPIEGITKTVSVWIIGRNFNHDISLLIQDFFGKDYELYIGKLNFQGWKKMTVAIPPQTGDGLNGVIQRSYHYNNKMGIKILGFRIDCDLAETFGSYYIYFDDLRAVTDLFTENNRDADDMVDGW
ncbi:MAG: flagellar filament outer layer protein FlaA [Treponema sp.]|jgi:hypothetical protein|nr:flagellar filament outer layer protein FlaA [Treponema sp.]